MKNPQKDMSSYSIQSKNPVKNENFGGENQEKSDLKYDQILKPLVIQKLVSFSPMHDESVAETPNFNSFGTQTTFENQKNSALSNIEANKQKAILKSQRKLLLSFEIQIDNEKFANLKFFENDDIQHVARDFCSQYSLPQETVPFIEQNIQNNLQKLSKNSKMIKQDKVQKSEVNQRNSEPNKRFVSQMRPALVLALEIEGKSQELEYFHHQHPAQVAEEFCHKYNLVPEAQHYIQKTIEYNLSKQNKKPKRYSLREKGTHPVELQATKAQDRHDSTHPLTELKNDLEKNNSVNQIQQVKTENEYRSGRDLIARGTEKIKNLEKVDFSQSNLKDPGPKANSKVLKEGASGKNFEEKEVLWQESYEKWQNLIKQKNIERDKSLKEYDEATGKKELGIEVTKKFEKGSTGTERLNIGRYSSISPTRTFSGNDIFTRLYYQGMRFKRKKRMSEEERESNLLNDEELTFHPKISAFKFSSPRYTSSDENRFYDEMKIRQQKEALILIERERLIREQCPFTPTPSEFSRELYQNRANVSIEYRLYNTILERAQKRRAELDAVFDEIHPFKPTINSKTLEILKKKKESKGDKEKKTTKTKEEKLDRVESQEATTVSKQREEDSDRSKSNQTQKINKQGKDDNPKYEKSDNSQINEEGLSSKLGQSNTKDEDNLLRKLFNTLDTNSDGIISLKDINISTNLTPKSIEMITKLFQERNVVLSYEEFSNELSRMNLVKDLLEEIHTSSSKPIKSNEKQSETSRVQANTPPLDISSNNRSLPLYPKIETLLKRFNGNEEAKSMKTKLSKKEIKSNNSSLSEIVDPKKTSNKFTKHYKKLLLKPQSFEISSFDLESI